MKREKELFVYKSSSDYKPDIPQIRSSIIPHLNFRMNLLQDGMKNNFIQSRT